MPAVACSLALVVSSMGDSKNSKESTTHIQLSKSLHRFQW